MPAAVSGLHSCQLAWMSLVGWSSRVLGTLNRRIIGLSAAATSGAESEAFLRGNSILDWPPASQMSPTNTLVNVSGIPALIVSVPGCPGLRLCNQATHLPSLTRAATVCCSKVTVTSAPSTPQPHTGVGASRCRIMLSEKMLGTRTADGGWDAAAEAGVRWFWADWQPARSSAAPRTASLR